MSGIAWQKSFFIIRLLGGLGYEEAVPWREIGPIVCGARSARTGVPDFAMERKVTIEEGEGGKQVRRLIRLNSIAPTRDGENVRYLLTNLSESAADVWDHDAKATVEPLAAESFTLAGKIKFEQYRKHSRGPKKPAKPRTSDPKHPHVSTKKLLDVRV